MLTADHVRARRKSGELIVRPLGDKERERALELAEAYLGVAREHVGRRRDELEEAWDAVPIAPRDKRLADGLRKLIEDGCEFNAEAPVEPHALRSDVFLVASAARNALAAEARFDRAAVVGLIAEKHALGAPDFERSLYADLKGEQLLLSLAPVRAAALVERYDSGQIQAVLLRAVRVIADVDCASPGGYRALFRELKFRRLMYRIQPRDGGGYRIELDGPYSLFDSVTKYGLQLALVLPALEACDALALVAEIRWGKQREPLTFRYMKGSVQRAPGKGTPRGAGRGEGGEAGAPGGAPAMRDDVATLMDTFRALGSLWQVKENTEILDLPGIGVCVPDLVFQRGTKGERVYFEALGFWSRDAVWKRVELVKQGLGVRILFAASSRLRVSEAVLDDEDAGALYVYKGVMSARSIERKLDTLFERSR